MAASFRVFFRFFFLILLFCGASAALAATYTFIPVADAYVSNGPSAGDLNFGSSAELRIQNSGTSPFQSYIKFDTSFVPNITSAKIRIYAALTNGGAISLNLSAVPLVSWSESAITWNNKPAISTVLGSGTVSTYSSSWVEIDVGGYVQAEFNAGRKVVSFNYSAATASPTYIVANSKESSYPPELFVTYNIPPSVSITAPTNGATYTAPASITLTANASDSDGTISKVEFYNGATLLGTVNNAPYTLNLSGVAAGSYTYTAKAYDNASATTTSSVVNVTVNVASAGGGILTWSLDEGAGTTATDSSGQSNTGTFSGSPVWVPGKVGSALSFNGYGYTGVNRSAVQGMATGNAPHTIAAWVKVNALPGTRAWIALLGPEQAGSHHWLINSAGGIQLGVWSGGQVAASLPVGEWKHVTMTFDGSQLKGYINGNLIDTQSAAFNFTGTAFTVATTHVGEESFNGVVDDVRIYNRALSATEVASLLGATPIINVTSVVDGTVGGNYSQTLTASGGTGPYTWSVSAGSLPAGLNLSPGGILSGTPTTAGANSFTLRVQDSLGASTTLGYSLNVNNAGPRTNIALQTNGGVVSASSSHDSSNFPTSAVNNGDSLGTSYWNDNTRSVFPDWVQVKFPGGRAINEIDVYTVQDNASSPVTPTSTMTFTQYGLTAFDVQYWNGSSWVTVPSGSITGNNLVWRKLTFPTVTTDRIRVLINAVADGLWSRVVEVEAYTAAAASNIPPSVSLTAPTNGATYTAPASITLTANASDSDGTISKVEFYNGATLLGTVNNAPYTLNLSGVAAGSYTYTAKAYDNASATTTSSVVNVTVNPPANVPPTVSLTAPANGASYTLPATVTLSANAADSDGSISKVEFYDGATLIATDTTSPYSYAWVSPSVGSHMLTAKAYDNSSAVTTSSVISITVNAANIPPSVSITAPANGATYTAPASITLTANASDSDGTISKVEFYNGATLLGTVNNAPYTLNLSGVAAGSYTYTAKAYDNASATTTSSVVNVTVNPPANVPPSVSLTAPTNGATYTAPASITLTANASDSDGTISKVEFYNGATLLGTVNNAPYTLNLSGVAAGSYTYTAKAYDNASATTTSSVVNVTVGAANSLPTVSITAPADGASYTAPATIFLSANPADSDGSINRVEYYKGSTLLGAVTESPYAYLWTGVDVGTYVLTAKTYDNLSAVGVSSPITITVSLPPNEPPTISLISPVSGASFNAPALISLTANASDADGSVSQVEFFSGATSIGVATRAPFSFDWPGVPAGNYSITAKATDNKGATTTSSAVPFTVNALPAISITSPLKDAMYTAPASIVINAAATDSDNGVARVEFYNGTTLLNTDTVSPYSYTWTGVPPGAYTLTAIAYDNTIGSTKSTPIPIIVNAVPDVSITAPANNASFLAPAAITIDVMPSDADGTIAKVELFNGASLLTTLTRPPYSYTWTGVATGTYNLTAIATDDRGASKTSGVVVVSVNTAPVINILTPADRDIFPAGSSVSLTSTATDDGYVQKVEYYNGATKIGDGVGSTYAFNWATVAAGTYTITAKATDDKGNTTISAPISITFNSPPATSLKSPLNGAVFTAPAAIPLEASATDSDGAIQKVQFYNGGTLIQTLTALPYTYVWNGVGGGSYSLTSKVTDDKGAITVSSPVVVTVNAPPAITLLTPTSSTNVTAPATVSFTASAADADSGILKVEYYNGSTKVGESNAPPSYAFNWNGVAAGTYIVTAKAIDNGGAVSVSDPLTLTVNAPPFASITAPASGTSFNAGANITINASAIDSDGTITDVEFFNGATSLGHDSSSPYSFTWTSVPAGTYSLTIKAYDNKGGVTTSSAVPITVTAAPTTAITAPLPNATFLPPASITITATASDVDSPVTKVEFYSGATYLGQANAAPYTYTWNGVVSGSYSLTVKAYDASGNITVSNPVPIQVNKAPSVSLSSPTDQSTYTTGSNIVLTANASDEDGTITKVEFYSGTTLLAPPDTNPPYTLTLNNVASTGVYAFTAKAYDNLGAVTTSNASQVTVTSVGGNVKPYTAVFFPVNNATFAATTNPQSGVTSSPVKITAYASDPDGTIASVKFYVNGILQYNWQNPTTLPYLTLQISMPPGTYTTYVVVTDNGNGTTQSATTTFTVVAPNPADIAPNVGVAYPVNNSKFMASASGFTSFPFLVSAVDPDGSINRVEFWDANSGLYFGTVSTPPFGVMINLTGSGNLLLKTIAFDNLGVSTSATSAVTVLPYSSTNILPAVSLDSPADGLVVTAPAVVPVTVTANDSDGINRAELFINGSLFAVWDQAPYTLNVGIPTVGTYSFMVRVYDNLGAFKDTPIKSVTVNAPPTVSILSPTSGTGYEIPATITLTAEASDSDGSITKVEYYNGASLIGTSNSTAPYQVIWSGMGLGSYTNITAKAYDDRGASTTSTPITVNVVPANSLPTINFLPALPSIVSAPADLTLSADARDPDGFVSKVEFYNGSTLLYTAPTGPYTYTWNSVPPGVYSITARVYDNSGAYNTTPPSVVTVNAPPSVSLTSPTASSKFDAPASITLSASASDVGGSIKKVEFYNGPTLLNSDDTSPYSYTWSGVPAGTYTFKAIAYDNLDTQTTSSPVTITVNSPPTVVMSAPLNNTVFPAGTTSVQLQSAPSDTDGTIAMVEYYNGAALAKTASIGPSFISTWDGLTANTYTITAKAYDNSGGTKTSAPITFRINKAPTGNLSAPAANAIFGTTTDIPLAVSAADVDGGISRVEYYQGTTLIGSVSTSPFSYTWRGATVGSYSLTAKIFDTDSDVTVTAAVPIKVATPPTILLTSPANLSTYTTADTVVLTATASGSEGVQRIEFYDGTTLIGSPAAPPYQATLASPTPGLHSITAKVYDNLGVTAISSAAIITVSAPPTPTVYDYDEMGRLTGVRH